MTAIARSGISASVRAVLRVSTRACWRATLSSSGFDAVSAASRWDGLAFVRASLSRFGLAYFTAIRSSSGSDFDIAILLKATSLLVNGALAAKLDNVIMT